MTDLPFSRQILLLGEESQKKLEQSAVLLFGVGGVGSYVAEALARAGVGRITLIDPDEVALSNCNRQLAALHSTLGQKKTQVMARRIQDINPQCQVEALCLFYGPETRDQIQMTEYDYIVDAIDTVSSKLLLAEEAQRAGVPLIASMGTGNKLDPSRFRIGDIGETSVCPLARVMRRELKARGIFHLEVLWSDEKPLTPLSGGEAPPPGRRQTPGSLSFVPSVAGLMIAGHVILRLAGIK
ncbi:tRNA threonylcarbamoyladenosine dehydratase [Ruminococcaceae bacterium AM07-15]|nr:tRNA threonylcarbamoyladenosine dehydratase [Ruminococcaceae bacterium AM07-15]